MDCLLCGGSAVGARSARCHSPHISHEGRQIKNTPLMSVPGAPMSWLGSQQEAQDARARLRALRVRRALEVCGCRARGESPCRSVPGLPAC